MSKGGECVKVMVRSRPLNSNELKQNCQTVIEVNK